MSQKHLFNGTLQEILVSKIVVKIVLKICGENHQEGITNCNICVVFV